MIFFSWLAVIIILTGSILNAMGKKISFIIFNVGNVLTITSAYYSHNWPIFVMTIGFGIINIFGYFNWVKKKIGT